MKPVRCLVVDDERLARRHVLRLLAERADIETVGEAATRDETLQAVETLRPELMILDVMMPDGGGFEILNALPDPPQVVFVTAHDRYAVRAFEVHALDYLLKPIDPERFGLAMDRAVQAIRAGVSGSATGATRLETHDLALVELGRSGHFVGVDRILSVESEGNYTRVTTDDARRLLARQPMKHWVRCLPAETFVQLDRGLVVNVRRIRSAELSSRAAHVLLGDVAHEIRLGAAATARLREVLGK